MLIFPVFKTGVKMPNISSISSCHYLPGWKKSQTPLSISLLPRGTNTLISTAKHCVFLKMNSETCFLSVGSLEKNLQTQQNQHPTPNLHRPLCRPHCQRTYKAFLLTN